MAQDGGTGLMSQGDRREPIFLKIQRNVRFSKTLSVAEPRHW
jgi:hypothetical protein